MDTGGLSVMTLDRMQQGDRGGTAVVLLHGWGAPGTDLVPLARVLARPDSRFFVPAGPLAEGSGRAWWHLDPNQRPTHALGDSPPPGYRPNPQVRAARTAVQALLRGIQKRYAPNQLYLAGFSQGAMLSLDVALAANPPVDKVGMLSGVILADSLENLVGPRATHMPVFVSHGEFDPVLPFASGERAKDILTRHGYPVTWHPFAGNHEIPPEILDALGDFLFDS
jgi:phospholipase/carboxylesterase